MIKVNRGFCVFRLGDSFPLSSRDPEAGIPKVRLYDVFFVIGVLGKMLGNISIEFCIKRVIGNHTNTLGFPCQNLAKLTIHGVLIM